MQTAGLSYPMASLKPYLLARALVVLAAGSQLFAQAQAAPSKTDRAAAYYHYALGHLYSELAAAYGNRGDYINRAIENYRAAIKADASATFLSEELSDLYIQAGRIREAVQEAEKTLRENPNDLAARRLLGRVYTRMIGDAQQGRIDEKMLRNSIEQYQKITELTPRDADVWLILGRLHKIAQNSVEAEKAYKKVLEIEPDSEDAMTGLAMVYADLGDAKAASDLLRKVAEKAPSLRTLTALASTYEQMRDYALAAETLRRTLELAPGNIEIKRAYAQNLMLAGQYDEALKLYKELADADPKDAQAQLRLSQIYRQQRDFAKAREATQKAKDIDPNNLEIRYNDVALLEAEGRVADAIAALKDLLASTAKPNFSAGERGNRVVLLERLGLMQRSHEQYQEAVETFRQIADLDPEAGQRAAAQIVDTWRVGKDFNKALAEADAARERYPKDRLIRAVRASVLAELGRVSDAVAELKSLLNGKDDRETYITLAQVHEKGKNYPEMAKAIDEAEKLSTTKDEKEAVVFMRGAMYEKLKKYDAAETEFRKVLEINPGNASALNYLGYMLADRNVRLSEAHQLISKAVEAEPNNGAYLDSLGWVYFRMGKLEEAEAHLLRALERFSRDPTIHDHLGDVYFKQGRLKDAIAQWESSLREWDNAAPSEKDPAEVAKVQKKLESAKVRLAKENSHGLKQNRE